MEELDYYPYLHTRIQKKGKTNIIAVVTSYFFYSSFFEINIFNGLAHANLHDHKFMHNYAVNLFSTGGNQQELEVLLDTIVHGKRADGVIILNMKPSDEALLQLKEMNFQISQQYYERQGDDYDHQFPSAALRFFASIEQFWETHDVS